jgi:acyl carrier protein
MTDTTGQGATEGVFEQVVPLLEELIRDYDTEFAGGITPGSRLVADLAFDSLSIVMLTVAIEGRFKQRGLPFEHLLLRDGEYVDDLTVSDLVSFLESHVRHSGGAALEAS